MWPLEALLSKQQTILISPPFRDIKMCVKYKQSQSVKTNCFCNIIKIRGLFIDCDE